MYIIIICAHCCLARWHTRCYVCTLLHCRDIRVPGFDLRCMLFYLYIVALQGEIYVILCAHVVLQGGMYVIICVHCCIARWDVHY